MTKTKRTPTGHSPLLLLGLLAALLGLTAPAAAESPAVRGWDPTLAILQGAGLEAVLFGPIPRVGTSIDGPGAQATCIAECCDGSTQTCTGSSCFAVDADCDSGERGYCYGTATGTKYCPDCSAPVCEPDPPCAEEPHCESLNGSPCSTFMEERSCSFSDGSCGGCFCDGSNWTCTI